MARPRKELNDTKIDKKDLKETVLLLAKKNGYPSWAINELVDIGLNEYEAKKHDESISGKELAGFYCWLYPEHKYSIKRKFIGYRPPYRNNRTAAKNRLRTNLRTNIEKNGALVNTLSESMMELILGFSIDTYMGHIEAQFKDGWSWENQGSSWHIDHIIPCAKLRYRSFRDESFGILWSLDNLRPLDRVENLRKGSSHV